MSDARTDAAHKRMRMHKAVATCDLEALREAINELYDPQTSPLAGAGMKSVRAYAPMIEAAILARIFAPGSAVQREMDLNLKHTRKSFGITDDEYASILDQLDTVAGDDSDDSDSEPEDAVQCKRSSACTSTDWCVGTSLHGKVKPARHLKFFERARQEEEGGGREESGDSGD